MSDAKAIKILKETYWNPKKGWNKSPVSEDDFQYALNAGVMFHPAQLSHNDVVARAQAAISNTSKKKVVKAFISSLTSRSLEHRSALGSYACGMNLPTHSNSNNLPCNICGSYSNGTMEDLNVLNFERYKFGGVRHLNPLYIALDLELLEIDSIKEPSDESISILHSILDVIGGITSNKLSAATNALTPLLKSNKDERVGIVSTLGYCGILKVPNYSPFYKQYIPVEGRLHSSYSKSDWPFPADIWRPEFGVDKEAVNFWFGDYI